MNRRSILTAAALGLAVVIASAFPSFAQSNPLLGTWKTNLEKSKYTSGTAPKEQTSTYVQDGQNIKNMGKSVDYEGKPLETVLLHIYDGQPHPSTGNPLYDSSTYTKIDDHNIFWSRSKNGKQVMVGHMVMAPDGKSYTTTNITTVGKGGIDIAVAEKQ
jgi:hypothetical protein